MGNKSTIQENRKEELYMDNFNVNLIIYSKIFS